jgi:Alpha-L-arabinofuranosidase B (ABFB) domain
MNIAMTNSYQTRTAEILCEDALIPSDTAGIRLHLRRKHPADVKHFPAERTVLIMHGASFSSMSLFDVPVKIGEKDATFKLVPGLAGKGTSFESINNRGYFLRHENFRLVLAKLTDTKLFREDATFYVVPGLASSDAVSFESFNFPKQYIRHFHFELWVNPFDGSDAFRKDATFIKTVPPGGGTIDPGTNQVPVSE